MIAEQLKMILLFSDFTNDIGRTAKEDMELSESQHTCQLPHQQNVER
jgi:hypothetical protein